MSASIRQRRVVVTGSPGAGKTTTINLLAGMGLVTMPEAARTLIVEEQRGANKIFPWTDLTEFVRRLAEVQMRQFAAAGTDTVYYDRGLPDAIAFLRLHQQEPPPGYLDACIRCRYDVVVSLSPLANYCLDAQRPYSCEEAQRLDTINLEAYRGLGYEVIEVAELPASERASLIRELMNKS